MKRSLSLMGGALCGAVLLTESGVQAHFDMLEPLVGRQGDQKARPCEGKERGPVYAFEPGAIITLGADENIAHDGYFRIAFDDDGTDGFKDPQSIDPLNPARDRDDLLINLSGGTKTGGKCIMNAADKCGKSDFCNVVSKEGKATVLWDNLDPHLMSGGGKQYKWTIKLPDVECNNCTLQIIQVMEDIGGHGPYDLMGDLYYRCVDIELKKGAGTSGPGNSPGPVQAGTPNPMYPNANIDCAKGAPPATDAGVTTPDAAVADAGAGSDAGSTPSAGGAAGGTAGSAGGTTPGGAAAGGGGAAPGGAAGGAGSTTGGTGAPTGAGGGTAGGAPTTSGDDEDASCSVAFGGDSAGGGTLGMFVVAGLALARRRRRA